MNGAHALLTGATEIVLSGYVDALDTDIMGSEAESGDVFLTDSTDVGTPTSSASFSTI